MKIYFAFILLMNSIWALAQNETIVHLPKAYRLTIVSKEGAPQKGYFAGVSDSVVFISIKPQIKGNFINQSTTPVPYSEIEIIRMKRKGSIPRGLLLGTLIGATSGILLGYLSGDDSQSSWISFTAEEKAFGLGVFNGTLGAITGTILGALIRKEFIINGNREKHLKYKRTILEMTATTGY